MQPFLTFLSTTNSFSAVVRLFISSSYLQEKHHSERHMVCVCVLIMKRDACVTYYLIISIILHLCKLSNLLGLFVHHYEQGLKQPRPGPGDRMVWGLDFLCGLK